MNTSLQVIDWTICLLYLGIVFALGLRFVGKQSTNDDFFVAGKTMHWLPVGLSLFATQFSSNSFVGLPAEAAFQDYHLLLAIWFIPLVIAPLACIYFVPFYRRLRLTSVHEYLEKRFSRGVRLTASAAFMAYSAGWMGSMLVASGKILQPILGLEDGNMFLVFLGLGTVATVYSALGGVRAVIWTDTLQAFALGGGMLFLLTIVINQIDGGWTGMIQAAWEQRKFAMFRLDGGFSSPNLFSACAFGFFVYLAGEIAYFTSVQRFASVPTARDAQRAVILKGVFIAFSCTLFFVVGTSLFVFYSQSAPSILVEFADGKRKDQLLPHFVLNYSGGFGMVGLLLAGLFAAAMSSLDSSINSMTASVVNDWLDGREVGAVVNRSFTVVFGALAVTIACLLQTINLPIFNILMSITGASLGVVLAVLLLGMLVDRSNSVGAYFAFASGLAGFAITRTFHLQNWWDGAFVTLFGFLGGFAGMYFGRPPTEKQLRDLMIRGSFKPRRSLK